MTQDIEINNSIKHIQSGQDMCLEFSDNLMLPALYGHHNEHLSHLEQELDISISDRGNIICLSGADECLEIAQEVINRLWSGLQKNEKAHISKQDIDATIRFIRAEHADEDKKNMSEEQNETEIAPKSSSRPAEITTRKKKAAARTPAQSHYIQALKDEELVFGVGPAGTGKTYLAVGVAVEMYEKKLVDRMVFCRPAVEAGEKLGFLPGDLKEKVDPYLRPIYDALYDFMGLEKAEKLIERGDIEIAPLAFMRGRTLSHAFVLLDEAQNTTSAQMKMFLSRMGENSRMIVTGDPHQTDLPPGHVSGLTEAIVILEGIKGTDFTTFTNKDVVRHRMVRRVLDAYERNAR